MKLKEFVDQCLKAFAKGFGWTLGILLAIEFLFLMFVVGCVLGGLV